MQNTAFRCGLALVFLAIYFGGLAKAQEWLGQQQRITNSAICQQPFPDFSVAWSLCSIQSKPVEKDETDWRYPDCAYPNSHDEADLCEQRKMSASADQSVFLGWSQLALSAFGFAALIYTLYLTRRSTEAAEVAAQSAADSNKIAHKNAKRELRAYLFVSKVKITENYSCVRMVVKNAGQTPAKDVTAHINTYAFPIGEQMPLDFTFPDYEVSSLHSSSIIGPSQEHIWGFKVSRDRLLAIKEGSLKVYIYGWFKYRDAFDEPQELTFCYEGLSLGNNIGRLVAHHSHNEST